MAVLIHEVRIRGYGEILLIERTGYLDYLPLTIITEHKEITLVTDLLPSVSLGHEYE